MDPSTAQLHGGQQPGAAGPRSARSGLGAGLGVPSTPAGALAARGCGRRRPPDRRSVDRAADRSRRSRPPVARACVRACPAGGPVSAGPAGRAGRSSRGRAATLGWRAGRRAAAGRATRSCGPPGRPPRRPPDGDLCGRGGGAGRRPAAAGGGSSEAMSTSGPLPAVRAGDAGGLDDPVQREDAGQQRDQTRRTSRQRRRPTGARWRLAGAGAGAARARPCGSTMSWTCGPPW